MLESELKAAEFLAGLSSEPKIVVVCIGLPGSSKSTFCQAVKSTATCEVAIHSADSFFLDESGVYFFDAKKLGYAHKRCFEGFEQSLKKQIPIILIDNTGLKRRDRNRYVSAAKAAAYEAREIKIGEFTKKAAILYASRNRHGVPLETINKMLATANLTTG